MSGWGDDPLGVSYGSPVPVVPAFVPPGEVVVTLVPAASTVERFSSNRRAAQQVRYSNATGRR